MRVADVISRSVCRVIFKRENGEFCNPYSAPVRARAPPGAVLDCLVVSVRTRAAFIYPAQALGAGGAPEARRQTPKPWFDLARSRHLDGTTYLR